MAAFSASNEFSGRAEDDQMKRREKALVPRGENMSAFTLKNKFSGAAVDNRMKRRQKVTPFMRWEFRRDLFRMLRNIRNVKPSIDQGPPKQPSVETMNRSRRIVEEGRLRVIEKENQQILERLRKIHNRPRSHFCHLKRRGDYLIKGDAFRLTKPTSAGYLVRLYKDLTLANPVTNRKSIRIQQEMLTSAMDLVQASNRNKPSEELIDSVVQLTLETVEEVPSSPDATTSEDGALSDGEGVGTFKRQQEHSRKDDESGYHPKQLDMLASPDAMPTKPESTGK